MMVRAYRRGDDRGTVLLHRSGSGCPIAHCPPAVGGRPRHGATKRSPLRLWNGEQRQQRLSQRVCQPRRCGEGGVDGMLRVWGCGADCAGAGWQGRRPATRQPPIADCWDKGHEIAYLARCRRGNPDFVRALLQRQRQVPQDQPVGRARCSSSSGATCAGRHSSSRRGGDTLGRHPSRGE